MVLSKDLKIAICFGLIMGAIISICNLCFAFEDVSYDGYIPNATLASNSINSGEFFVYYLNIQPGYIYHATVTGNPGVYSFGNSLEINSETSQRVVVNNGETFDFTYDDYDYIFFLNRSTGSSLGDIPTITLTREALPGMTYFIDNIAYSLSIGNLSSVWVYTIPILAISVLVGLGVYLIRRVINKIKKKKGGI